MLRNYGLLAFRIWKTRNDKVFNNKDILWEHVFKSIQKKNRKIR